MARGVTPLTNKLYKLADGGGLASTTFNELGHDQNIIEAALAHVDKNETRRTYKRGE